MLIKRDTRSLDYSLLECLVVTVCPVRVFQAIVCNCFCLLLWCRYIYIYIHIYTSLSLSLNHNLKVYPTRTIPDVPKTKPLNLLTLNPRGTSGLWKDFCPFKRGQCGSPKPVTLIPKYPSMVMGRDLNLISLQNLSPLGLRI